MLPRSLVRPAHTFPAPCVRWALSVLVGIVLAGLLIPTTARAQLHVKPGASGGCSSWSDACDLQDALGQAGGNSEIWIAEGTYTPGSNRGDSFTIDGNQDGVELYGGFDGTETTRGERDPGAHPVVLSGDIDGDGTRSGNSNNVLMLRGLDYYGGTITRATRIDGVTVTGGNAVTDDEEYGGGLYCMGNGPTGECSPTLTNVVFVDNYADFSGGALFLNGRNDGKSNPLIRNAVFANNTSRQGGAIYNEGFGGLSSPDIEGSVFVDNRASSTLAPGGAIYNAGYESDAFGNGESAPTITNSIFWGNTANDQIQTEEASGATIEHSIVENGCPSGSTCDAATVDAPPRFLDIDDPDGADEQFRTADDGLRLGTGSPALNAGDDNAVTASNDITGGARIQDGTVDLGPYEGSVDISPTLSTIAPSAVEPGNEITITGTFFNDIESVSVDDVTLDGTSLSYAVDSETQITATVPPGATDGPVAVTTTIGTAASSAPVHIADPPLGSGQALALDGSGDYVEASDDIRLDNRSFSISFWARRASTGGDDYVIGQGAASSTNQSLHVGFRSSNEFTVAFYDNDLDVSSTYTDTNWHHWAVTYDADTGNRTVYRDGIAVGSDQASADFQGTGPLLLGTAAIGDASDDFNGSLDEVRVWHSVRTRAEIRASMHETLGGTEDHLIGYWRFDENSAATTYDYAGPHRGTIEGDPQRTASPAPMGQQSIRAATTGETALGPSGAQVAATPDATDDGTYLTLYSYGSSSGAPVETESFPSGVTRRSSLVWGVEETGDVTADLTFSYAGIENISLSGTRLLKRDGPTGTWQDVTDQFTRDAGERTLTGSGVTEYSEFVMAEASVQTVYVDADAPNGGDGFSWATAYNDLQDALATADGDDAIWIAEGIYTPGPNQSDRFTITGADDGLQIYGGFAGDESSRSERDPQAHPTVLSGDIDGDDTTDGDGVTRDANDISGDNSNTVLLLDGTTGGVISGDTVIDGVIVTGGQASGSDLNGPSGGGGGLYCNGSDSGNACYPTIENTSFYGNTADAGGALFCFAEEGGASSPQMNNLIVAGNSASYLGGGLYNNGRNGGTSSPVLTNVVFADNRSSQGGAIYNNGYNGTSSPVITNATITGHDNSAIHNEARNGGTSNPVITNTVLYDNGGDDVYNNFSGTATMRYTLIEDGCPSDATCDNATIWTDAPHFADASTPAGPDGRLGTTDDGLRLTAGSPALNAGDNSAIDLANDISGAPRTQNGTVDLGAYETDTAPAVATVSPRAAIPGAPITLTGDFFSETSRVTIGETDASYAVDSGTQLTATMPEGASTGPVEIETPSGTATSSAEVHAAAAPYGSGEALALDGTDDYLNAGSDLRLDNRSFTISFWARRASTGSDHYVIGQGSSGSSNQSLHVGFRSSDVFTIGFYSDDLDTPNAYTDSRWHHWAVTYNDATGDRAIYRDGVEVASDRASGAFEGTGDLYVGAKAFDGAGRYFDGQIDEVRVWHRARTQAEIRQGMHRTLVGNEADLAAYFRFSASNGQTAYDHAGRHSASFQGDPEWTASGAALGQTSAVVVSGAETVGPTGGDATIENVSVSGSDALALYQYGTTDGPVITAGDDGEDFSALGSEVTQRLHAVWGLDAFGSAAADVTFDYSNLIGLVDPSEVRLLKRDRPGAPWQDVSADWTWDESAQTFSKQGASTFSEYAIGKANTALPVEMTAFEGRTTGTGVTLTWTTAAETDNAGFRIQRQMTAKGMSSVTPSRTTGMTSGPRDGATAPLNRGSEAWKTVGSVEGAGTTDEAQSYRFTDADVPYAADSVSYRLKQVDTDGRASYSEPITVARSGPAQVTLLGPFPNPARQRATVRYALPDGTAETVTLRLYDVMGRQVRVVEANATAGRHQLQLGVDGLASGVYFLRLAAGGTVQTQKVTVVR